MRMSRILPLVIFFFFTTLTIGQEASKVFEFKKGEVLDFLYLITKPDTDAIKKRYFEEAFPVAQKNGYTPLGGLGVKQTPYQGNYHPEAVGLGKWSSLKQRKDALRKLEEEVDGFHKMRREIWSTFNLVYFELEEDLKIEIRADRFYVVTNFWKNEGDDSFDAFTKKWDASVLSSKGSHVVQLKQGSAPYGYRFNPDYISITSWNSEADFLTFLQTSKASEKDRLYHINQFRIQ